MSAAVRGSGRRLLSLGTVALLVFGMTTVAATVAPAPDAAAATISLGTIQAQMADQKGQNSGTGGLNCITYAPTGTATSSALVPFGKEAQTGHGSQNSKGCPAALSTSTQSVVGFQPSAVNSVDDGKSFLIGRMIHYNNPVYSDDRYFTGKLNAVLGGFTAPNTLAFDWRLDETPNTGGNNCCDDEITFTNQISTVTLTQGGLNFRLVIQGFVPVGSATACPPAPGPNDVVKNDFFTVEGTQTHACLYASLVQLRTLTVVKTVVGTPPGTPSFNFTSTSVLAGSAWSNSSFALNSGGSVTRELISGNTVTVTETDPGDDRWSLTGLTCYQYLSDGVTLAEVPGATLNTAARQVVLANIPAPLSASRPGITCTYTNTYTPRATLTLVKQVSSGNAAPALWTLTATGSAAAPPSGRVISGPSGSAAVTGQRVPAGSYALSETGTGAASTGYVQVGDWACRTAGGGTVPVNGGNVTLPDSAAATGTANVTCTATNRFATGSLQITKAVTGPTGAYTGGTGKTFAGSYDCGAGAAGSFSTLTTAVPVTINNIPAGRTCTVAETLPTGGLANASYAWGPATFSTQPVTITDGGTAVVAITNPIVQRFGSFAIRKIINGPGGYVGGTGRVFPVSYNCTLTDGPPTAGTLDLTTAASASPTTQIPVGSVCSFTENLTAAPGDFSDPSYVWVGQMFSPSSVPIADGTTAQVELTNTYQRETGSLVLAKVVTGDGYLGGSDENFTVTYDCGTGFTGQVTIAAGGTRTIPNLPARLSCAVQELPPATNLLGPGFTWGTPTWSPGFATTIPVDSSVTLTVSNPTQPIFGTVTVTKAITGETQGVTADAQFGIRVNCPAVPYDSTFTVGAGGSAATPNLPVGSTCTVSEQPPTGGLVDGSYGWGTAPADQQVAIGSAGEVVPVTVTNTVVRVNAELLVAKALIDPDHVVDPVREFQIGYSCRYGADAPVVGTVSLPAGSTSTPIPVLTGSSCTVAEVPDTLTAPPAPGDPSRVWSAPSYGPVNPVTVGGPPVTVTVTNTVTQLTGSFLAAKSVTGAGKPAGYVPGSTFGFSYSCTPPAAPAVSGSFTLADGDGFAGPTLPAGSSCVITETSRPAPSGPAYGWDEPFFYVAGQPVDSPNRTVTFTVPEGGIQTTAFNPITPRTAPVEVSKLVTGLTEGLVAGTIFPITLNCGSAGVFVVSIQDGQTQTQDDIPVGSVCAVTESTPADGLVDASYAWDAVQYTPASVTVGTDPAVVVTNTISRVTAPVRVVKSYTGPQGVVDPARTYPVTFSCTYDGTEVAGGLVQVTVDPAGVPAADDVPVTSVCTATEGDLDPPSADPAFRWLDPVITGVTVAPAGPNTIGVANSVTRDSGTVLVRKEVTGAREGYVNLGTGAADFTLHGQCSVPDQPTIPTRYADGVIADGGIADGGIATQVPITASIGWSCSGYEDTPGQSLLKDSSYAWAPPIPNPAGSFVLTRDNPTQVFLAQNPIVRVYGTFSITKDIVDPNGVVLPSATFAGRYSCKYGSDDPVEGDWSITPAVRGTFTVPTPLLLNSVCSVTENDPGTSGLPDGSWAWSAPSPGTPDTVVEGATASTTITNTVTRLWAGLSVAKTVVAPQGGVQPGIAFGGVWNCDQGRDSYAGRFSIPADGTTTLFVPADQRVPATAICTVAEDTPDAASQLVDGSFAWDLPTYQPVSVTLVAGATGQLGITNTVVRVYSDVTIQKAVTGPASEDGKAPVDRPFTGSVSCQYGTDPPVVSTWSASVNVPGLRAGVLVGSVCSATEDPPGAGGQPVTGDPSYVWLAPVIGAPVTVTAPDIPSPPLVVTNPTDRLFGTFTVAKTVTGAVEGIVDPSKPYLMNYACKPKSGSPITGELQVIANGVRTVVGPDKRIPIDSECVITEPAGTLPPLLDTAWAFDDPTFTIDGAPAPPGTGRDVTFTIPGPQENAPEPLVAVGVRNNVTKTAGAYTVSKSSDPPSGSTVQPGDTITYTLTVDSTGTVPIHNVVVTDDLAEVLPYATLQLITVPGGTTATVDLVGQQLVWTVGTVPADPTPPDPTTPGPLIQLTYEVTLNQGAAGITVANHIFSSADVAPTDCATPDAGQPVCSTEHPTTAAPTIVKQPVGVPQWDPATGAWTVQYQIVATNPNGTTAVPYSLTDTPGFPAGTEIRSAAVTLLPDGVTPADPPWDGGENIVIAQNVSLPAGATHTYQVTIEAVVPLTTPVATLTCDDVNPIAGTGFFNQAALQSLGSTVEAVACVPIPVVLSADKEWQIDGVSYPDGSQPDGFGAAPTLNGQPANWRTEYSGFPPETAIEIDEVATVPLDCSNEATGLGAIEPETAFTSITVVNVVTCDGNPLPPIPPVDPINPVFPVYPVYPVHPVSPGTLPNTGFAVEPFFGWGFGLILVGAMLLLGGGRLGGGRRRRNG